MNSITVNQAREYLHMQLDISVVHERSFAQLDGSLYDFPQSSREVNLEIDHY